MSTLPDLRDTLSTLERQSLDWTIQCLYEYIFPLLMERQQGLCNACGEGKESFDIDHIIYHPQMTIHHLQLLCRECHLAKHNNSPILRNAPKHLCPTT